MMPLVCVLMVFLLSGCMQMQMLPYLDQALVLKDLSAEKDRQNKYVFDADARFDKLLAAVQGGDIKNYRTQDDIAAVFGAPIATKDIIIDGKTLKQCLYRYAIQSKSPKRIYLYFDARGQLNHWESL